MDAKPIKNLGCMNGWREEPAEYTACKAARDRGEAHELTGRTPWNCYHETTCHTCGIRFAVDSSD
jgi:hypothetical protein